MTQQTEYVDPMLAKRWARLADDGPTLVQCLVFAMVYHSAAFHLTLELFPVITTKHFNL